MRHKMENAVNRNKIRLIKIYGEDPRYKNLGICIKELENNPVLLLEELEKIKGVPL